MKHSIKFLEEQRSGRALQSFTNTAQICKEQSKNKQKVLKGLQISCVEKRLFFFNQNAYILRYMLIEYYA